MKFPLLLFPLLSLTALEWTPLVELSSEVIAPQSMSAPQVAINTSGSNTIAVWEYFDGGNGIIQSATYTNGNWIINPNPISAGGGSATSPQIAISSERAIVVWELDNGVNTVIQAAIYDGTTWTAPAQLINTGNSSNPQVVINSSNTAIAIWQNDTGDPAQNTLVQIATNPGSPPSPSGWGTPITASIASSTYTANNPQIGIDSSGNAIAVWEFITPTTGTPTNIFIQANTYAGGWGTPTPLTSTLTGTFAITPQIAVDPSGNGVAIWEVPDNPTSPINSYIQVNGYISGSWGPLISLPSLDIETAPQIAVDGAGNATAVWQYISSTVDVQAATLPFGSTSPTIYPSLNTSGNATVPQIAVNAAGQAIAVWQLNTGSDFQTEAAILPLNGTTWIYYPDLISEANLKNPQVAIDSSGNAVVISQFTRIMASAIQAAVTQPSPPTNLSGQTRTNHFLTQSNFINFLIWEPSADPSVVAYQLFQNNTPIATIPASHLEFPVPIRPKTTNTYTLTAVNEMGTQSSPISITVP